MSITEKMIYGRGAPYQTHSDTSQASADALTDERLSYLEQKVYRWLSLHGPAMDWEMQEHIPMDESTQRPRRLSLKNKGLVVQVGEGRTRFGKKAKLWDIHRGATQTLLSLETEHV